MVFKNQHQLSPKAQYELTRRFDPASESYGHGKTIDAKRSILHPDLKTVPHQPQVQVIGNGFVPSYEGLENVQLRHPHHRTFHKDHVPDEKEYDFTRFYRWHIDAALYGLHPPQVTTLLAVNVPKGRHQTLLYDDDSEKHSDFVYVLIYLNSEGKIMKKYFDFLQKTNKILILYNLSLDLRS